MADAANPRGRAAAIGGIEIRPEAPGDHPAVEAVLLESFPGAAEAGLVARLRRDGDASIALVATAKGAVCGHVMFSRMRSPERALGLGPVAVRSDFRRRGIAAAMIGEGLHLAGREGWRDVFVLGDPAYYRRFGFSAEAAAGFESPYAGPYFMRLVLAPDEAQTSPGAAEYAEAFAALA